jgi:hypothetical protein
MLRASLGKVVHTVQRAGTFAAKVSPQELHKIAVHVRAVQVPQSGASTKRPLLRTLLPYITVLVCVLPCIIYS